MSACLICNNSVIQNDSSNLNISPETLTYLESQVKVIFLLQKLLNVSTFRCENYLEKYGDPSTWISTCFECNSLLRDAYSYHCQIVKLQKKLSNIKGQVRGKIKTIKVKGHHRRRVTSLHAEIRSYCLEQEGDDDEDDNFDVKPDPEDEEEFSCPLLKAEAILDPDGGQGQEDNVPIKDEPFEISQNEIDSDDQIEDDDIDVVCGDKNDDSDYDQDSGDDSSTSGDDSSTSGETMASKRRKLESPSIGPDGLFICNHCTKTFSKLKTLRKHENRIHNVFYRKHKERKLSIQIRKPRFEDFIEPAFNGEFKCKICDKIFSKRDTLRRHQNVAHDLFFKKRLYESDGRIRKIVVNPVNPGPEGGEFNCSSCEKTFKTKNMLTRHTKFAHGKQSGENSETISLVKEEDDKTGNQSQTCGECNVTFSTKAGLTNHNYVLHFKDSLVKMQPKKRVDYLLLAQDVTLTPWKCSQCFTWWATEDEIDEHSRVVHNVDFSKVDLETNFKCDLCTKAYSTKANLLLHGEQVHAGEPFSNMGTMTVYQCEHCPRKFIDESRFEFHLGKVHQVLKNPKKTKVGGICLFCGLACHTHLYFHRHIHLHSGERNILCEFCSATFSEGRYLAFHKLRHHADMLPPQEKNALQCETCLRVFSTKDYLQVHVRTVHEKKYKFICDLCGAGREHESSFKQHMLSHGTRKMYACPHAGCNMSYKTNSGLSVHLSSHHSGKVWNCQFCEKEFNNRHDCRRHEEAVHTKTTQFTCHVCSKEFPIRDYYRNHIKRCHKKVGVENS